MLPIEDGEIYVSLTQGRPGAKMLSPTLEVTINEIVSKFFSILKLTSRFKVKLIGNIFHCRNGFKQRIYDFE